MRRIGIFGLAFSCAVACTDPYVAATPPPCGLAPHSPLREAVETKCDGVDNDCDGLVDVLMPVEANGCQGNDARTCAAGFAACEGKTRVCYAPGAAPEVADGLDNDCNGAVDDVPGDARAASRVLLLVPSYIWNDGAEEVDTIASLFEGWGMTVDRPAPGSDWTSSFATLDRYALVFIPGYLVTGALDDGKRGQLEAFANGGGVVVVTRPVEEGEGARGFPLGGLARSTRRLDVASIRFDGNLASAARAFDSPEERNVPLTDDPVKSPAEAYVFEPSGPETEAIAHAIVGGASVGAIVTRRKVGAGFVYSLGHDLHSFGHTRCYINCFEPSGDLVSLFAREALREAAKGHLVLKHTVPGLEDSVMFLTHDVDAPDAHRDGPWGKPGAVQVAELEKAKGARGTFLVTTDYVTPYYSAAMVDTLCAAGMCPLGDHSVRHASNFNTQPKGSCNETEQSYLPERETSLCGEIRVAKQILEAQTKAPILSFRSPYLYVHPDLYEVLESQGILADSSYAVGDFKFNLPLSLARTGLNASGFRKKRVFMFPIAVEDGIGAIVEGSETREEMQLRNGPLFVSMWNYALLRNADNHAYTNALLHPSYGVGVRRDNLRYKLDTTAKFLDAARKRGVKIDATMGELAEFWRARESTVVDARYVSETGYEGTIAVGEHAMTNLTLELGDAIGSFSCATCGDFTVSGKRVLLRTTLAAGSKHTFSAQPVRR